MKNKKKKNKNKTAIKQFLPINSDICITRYTFDAWLKCYPKSNEEEWFFQTHPENVIDFVCNACIDLENSGINPYELNKIHVVTIDDEYFKWLEETNNPNNESSRCRYATEKRNEAFRLLQKNNGDRTWMMLCLPILFMIPEGQLIDRIHTNITITKELSKKFHDYLKSCIHDVDIHVCDFVLRPFDFIENYDKIESICKSAITEGVSVSLREFDMQTYQIEDCNAALLYLPVMISEKLDSASFNPATMLVQDDFIKLERSPEELMFVREHLEERGLSGVPAIEESDFIHALQQLYPDANAWEFLIYIDEIENIEIALEETVNEMKREAKRKKPLQ